MSNWHDYFYNGPTQSLAAVGSAATVSTTGVFGSQTRFIQFAFVNSTGGAVWYSNVNSGVSSVDGAILPPNWVQVIKVLPGQQLFVRSNTIAASTAVYVTELTD